MSAKHTPTPWELIHTGKGPEDCMVIRENHTGGRYIAEIRPREHCENPVNYQANAAFIVRAANAHEALVKAAEVALGYVGHSHGANDGPCHKCQIEEALALAGEKVRS